MGVLRNPFVVSLVIALVAAVIALVAGVALTFSDLNDARVPDRIMGRTYSDHFRAFLRKKTGGIDFAGDLGDSFEGIVDDVVPTSNPYAAPPPATPAPAPTSPVATPPPTPPPAAPNPPPPPYYSY